MKNGSAPAGETWHVFDATAVWAREFTAALHRQVPVLGWIQNMSWTGFLEDWEKKIEVSEPAFSSVEFPLQRGYYRFPCAMLAPPGPKLVTRMKRYSRNASESPLICTSPFYAPIAELWPGPVVYYLTDFVYAYEGMNPRQVLAYDRRICSIATAVCVNSSRLAGYLMSRAKCPSTKVDVVPNGTRASNILPAPATKPAPLPECIADIPRPIAGVIGNLAANTDWTFLERCIELTPEFSWVFVGPITMPMPDSEQSAARQRLVARQGRVRFVGPKPYGELQAFARAFDVAVLPYRGSEPTYSGSSTRYYEHLAACRPILATRGFDELLRKEPLLRLVEGAEDAARQLNELRITDFVDGQETARWRASQTSTWENRASMVIHALKKRSKVKSVPPILAGMI